MCLQVDEGLKTTRRKQLRNLNSLTVRRVGHLKCKVHWGQEFANHVCSYCCRWLCSSEDLLSFLISLKQECCHLIEVIRDVNNRFPRHKSQVCLSICLSVCLSVFDHARLSVCLHAWLPVCPSIFLSFFLPVCTPDQWSGCLSACLSR